MSVVFSIPFLAQKRTVIEVLGFLQAERDVPAGDMSLLYLTQFCCKICSGWFLEALQHTYRHSVNTASHASATLQLKDLDLWSCKPQCGGARQLSVALQIYPALPNDDSSKTRNRNNMGSHSRMGWDKRLSKFATSMGRQAIRYQGPGNCRCLSSPAQFIVQRIQHISYDTAITTRTKLRILATSKKPIEHLGTSSSNLPHRRNAVTYLQASCRTQHILDTVRASTIRLKPPSMRQRLRRPIPRYELRPYRYRLHLSRLSRKLPPRCHHLHARQLRQ